MVKKELGLRERRKIYEDTICVVAQNQKIGASSVSKERAMRNMIEKQTAKCVSILSTVLGYHEKTVEMEDGVKTIMLIPGDEAHDYALEKSKFEDLVQLLPNNKELREALWKTCIKRDKKATAKLHTLIA
jgi:hypothetical protein